MSQTVRTIKLDISKDPYPEYEYLRSQEGILWMKRRGSWVISRYSEALEALKDRRLSTLESLRGLGRMIRTKDRDQFKPLIHGFENWMLYHEGEEHTRVRRLMNKGFVPSVTRALAPLVEKFADELIDACVEKGEMDISADFAEPLTVKVISYLLNVPGEDYAQIVRWSDDIAGFFAGAPVPEKSAQNAQNGIAEMIAYLKPIIAEMRKKPSEHFLSQLIQATEDGDVLTDDEFYNNLVSLLFAGNETTRNLINNAVYLLLEHQAELNKLKANPDLWEGAVEEALRYEAPAQASNRVASEDLNLFGTEVKKGSGVMILLASANRDPDFFPDPNVFDIERKNNRHLSFGLGPHVCIGAGLARVEARVALQKLFERAPELSLDESREWVRSGGSSFRGFQNLPTKLNLS